MRDWALPSRVANGSSKMNRKELYRRGSRRGVLRRDVCDGA
jgi:hypothetical protein